MLTIKFSIEKASDHNFEDEIEINSLEELMKFADDNGSLVIARGCIIIYDGYLE